ncbi:tRNA glutamyl-Q(34) synthetase GluQRS [Sphingomonas sp.]|uniref:tRNA glutamyl-Q(34) synthetase GluQRS n=1 Tax=Sphingomonas sp. TaxID=28214 RepID=UPI003B3B7A17
MTLRISRFAPSPTGRLHLGHAYSAVRAHDLARHAAGRFLLRIEDIDRTRSRETFVTGIEEDLRWLGLTWDGEVIRQSRRMPVYATALERLKDQDLLYPCFCTRSEIAASASAPHGPEGQVYPGTCRSLDSDVRARRAGEPHCWRLDMARAVARVGPLRWHDATAGWIAADPLPQGDVVLARKETPTSYHLAVVIDDAAQDVTDVVRGVDLSAATHVHRLLQALLDLPTPAYHHHPLLVGADGARLAKRNGAMPLATLRAEGADPDRLIASLRSGRVPIGVAPGKA